MVKATKKNIISTDTVVVCLGTKRDCQCHTFVTVTKSFFCVNTEQYQRLLTNYSDISMDKLKLHLQKSMIVNKSVTEF